MLFFNKIKNNCKVVFDVGCRMDSLFINQHFKIHYFEPVNKFLNRLKELEFNILAKFNNFGLSNTNAIIPYYPKSQSFLNRTISMETLENQLGWISGESILLDVKRGDEYLEKNNIKQIDFLKLDTEGFEFNVIQGFGKRIKDIKIIQFEYGGTWLDGNIKLDNIITYLKENGFVGFSYLHKNGECLITNTDDHFQYCNIICYNGIK